MPRSKSIARLLLALVLAFGAVFSVPVVASAQSAFPTVFPQPVLLIDQEVLFTDSALGKAVDALSNAERTSLSAESRGIDSSFEEEEKRLTEQRGELDPEAFRVLSDEFDTRVQAARQTQIGKDIALQQKVEARKNTFYSVALPYLSQIMAKYQASAVIDKSAVLLFNRNMDITQEAIDLLDSVYNENPALLDEFK